VQRDDDLWHHGDYITKFLKGACRPMYEIMLYRLWQLRCALTAESKAGEEQSTLSLALQPQLAIWQARES
jgi:hypothetical protein